MLNAKGGRIWVGCESEKAQKDTVAGYAPMPLAELEQHIARLQDMLVTRIEPPPSEAEVLPIPAPCEDGHILCIEVHPRVWPSRRPYCLRKGKERSFLVRRMSRLDVLTYEEIAAGFTHEDEWARFRDLARAEEKGLGPLDLPHLTLALSLVALDGTRSFPLSQAAFDDLEQVRTNSVLQRSRPQWRQRQTRIMSTEKRRSMSFSVSNSGVLVARFCPDPVSATSCTGITLPRLWGLRLADVVVAAHALWRGHVAEPCLVLAELRSHRLRELINEDDLATLAEDDFCVHTVEPMEGPRFKEDPLGLAEELLEYSLEHLGFDQAAHLARSAIRAAKAREFLPLPG